MKMFLLWFVHLVFVFDNNELTKIHAMVLSDNTKDLSVGLTSFAPLFEGVTQNACTTTNKHKAVHQDFLELSSIFKRKIRQCKNTVLSHSNNVKDSNLHSSQITAKFHNSIDPSTSSNLFKLLSSSISNEKWLTNVSDKTLKKRNTADKDNYLKISISTTNQKKAQALRHLLLNNVSNKNYDDIQDDYIEDDDDDYSKNLNKKKMNWEDYQNEDGASVMELVVLDARHKKHMRQASQNNYFY